MMPLSKHYEINEFWHDVPPIATILKAVKLNQHRLSHLNEEETDSIQQLCLDLIGHFLFRT